MKNTFLKNIPRLLLIYITLLSFIWSTSFSVVLTQVDAAYVESDSDSFAGYKRKIESALQDMEREFRVNNTTSDATLSNLRALIQEAYIRLPDSGESATKNDSLKKSTDLYLDLAAKNKTSSTHAQNAASQIARFISDAQIAQITGSISANPANGNAPLTSSFLATAKDPSGINIPDGNYIWWMREAGGYRRELGRSPSLTYTFSKEWNYQVFLDIVSESRNKKWKTDVTPLTISQDIEVKPRLGNVILLINGVNVSNIDTLKVSPTLWKIWLLFDATASRAVSNGVITKTKWDFGNGNTLEYDGAPILEKQLYVNPEMYKVSVEITTNQGQVFRKQIQLLIRDPAAVISLDKEVGYIWEDINMSAKSYLTNATNVEYTWEIQDINMWKKVISSKIGSTFNYKFKEVWQYLITLTTRNPNGNTDSDSRILVIEARAPIINLDAPKPLNTEKPNTFIFDASRSFDADTNNNKWLKYEWTIDGEKVSLNDLGKDGALWHYTFKEKGTHTVSLTVSNGNGKVSTVDKTFEVTSTLTVGVNISPRATAIGTKVGFQARAPEARFYEWDMGDGSPSINGTADFIEHIYKKTGTYNATLTVKNGDGTQENRITRKVYITDTDKPYALIDIKNSLGTVIEDPSACENPDGAFVVNRSDTTTIDGSNSINVDGNSAGLDYTWKYMDRVKTGPSLSEKFTELGCHPVELTVRSMKNGSTHTSKRYIQIKNIAPKITSVDASIDATKKNTQKLIVNVTANGARDDDGVITSYIWFYTTESDSEKQNVRITQTPTTTFVLPNVTEKYYFSVIAEDNDGARYDTSENVTDQKPLLIANDDSNINMPLITLTLDKSQTLIDEPVRFTAKAKNILWNDITNKSEYYWDFDGDSRIDQKTTDASTTHIYKKTGKYNMKVKVIHNGVSNTKYQVIYVKNELKAHAQWYSIGDTTYFLNASNGVYDSAKWNIGWVDGTSLYAMSIKNALLSNTWSGALGTLTIKNGLTESSSINIEESDIIHSSGSGEIHIQTYPAISADKKIIVSSASDKVLIWLYGNKAKEYRIDADTKIDSDIDGITDNDIDNKDSTSWEDGHVFALENLGNTKSRNRHMKVSLVDDRNTVFATEDIQIVLDFIPESNNEVIKDTTGTWSLWFSAIDKENLDALQAIIRNLEAEDRIIFTQYYNNLIENWWDLSDRTEWLLAIQKEVNASQSLTSKQKEELSNIIDLTLVGDAQAMNEISIASHVIEGLIPSENTNRAAILERLEKIKSNPANLTENKVLGKEILEFIETDTSISNENKLLIKSQLLTIVNGGQESISEEEKNALVESSSSTGGIIGFITGTVKIFLIILAIILFLFFIGFIAYRFSRKKSDMGFQDFLIDSIAHTKSAAPRKEDPASTLTQSHDTTNIIIPPTPHDPINAIMAEAAPTWVPVDPLNALTDDEEMITAPLWDTKTEVENSDNAIPDWLKPLNANTTVVTPSVSELTPSEDGKNVMENPVEETIDVITTTPSETPPSEPKSPEKSVSSSHIVDDSASIVYSTEPATIKTEVIVTSTPETIMSTNTTISASSEEPISVQETEKTPEEIIPDWLVPISQADTIEEKASQSQEIVEVEWSVDPLPPPAPDAELPDWLKSSLDREDTVSEVALDTRSWEDRGVQKNPKVTKNPKKKSTIKPSPKKVSEKSTPNTTPSDIPDWLK